MFGENVDLTLQLHSLQMFLYESQLQKLALNKNHILSLKREQSCFPYRCAVMTNSSAKRKKNASAATGYVTQTGTVLTVVTRETAQW